VSDPASAAREALDARLTASLDATLIEAGRLAGGWLACRPGCAECCIGPFPISRLDAERLRAGLLTIEQADPAGAAAVRRRAEQACRLFAEGFPGDPGTGRFNDDDRAADAFLARHGRMPCPALVPESGHCALYDYRPVSCRTFGPPVRLGEEALPPCRLCFVGAPPAEVERCRVEPDREGLEEALLAAWPDQGKWETLIAFALRGETAASSGTDSPGR